MVSICNSHSGEMPHVTSQQEDEEDRGEIFILMVEEEPKGKCKKVKRLEDSIPRSKEADSSFIVMRQARVDFMRSMREVC